MNRSAPLVRLLVRLLPLLAAGVALLALRRLLEELRYEDLRDTLARQPAGVLLSALALVALGYSLLVGYELLALRYSGRRVPLRRALFAGFASFAVSNTLGNPLLTSTPLRFRLYSAVGLGATDIAKVIAFNFSTFWLGLTSLGGVLLLLEAAGLGRASGLTPTSLRVTGAALLLIPALYLSATTLRRRPLTWRSWSFQLPTPGLAGAQIAVSVCDWTTSAAVLWVFLRPIDLPFVQFAALFLLASLLGFLSAVPGGLGVFDASMAFLLAGFTDPATAAAAILSFRLTYYLLPLAAAVALLIAAEATRRRDELADLMRGGQDWIAPLVPTAAAIVAFAAGGVLLIGSALPPLRQRLELIADFVPLPVLEASHLLASVIGTLLLVLALGLKRRLDAAYHLTVVLIGVSMVLTLLRGLDIEAAVLLAGALGLLLISRRHFYRRASLLAQPLSARWLVAVMLVLGATLWIGLFAERHVEYRNEMWWQFSLRSDAPRFLRASVGAAAVLLVVGAARLMKAAPPELEPPSAEERGAITRIVEGSSSCGARLAYLGDKLFLFDANRAAFVMFAVSGDTWVAMGDPVGPEAEWPELIWRYRELCDRHHERPVFYQVRDDALTYYIDVGLEAFKLGEAGRVPLDGLTLEGRERKDLRQSLNRAQREGLEFSIVSRRKAAALLPELEQISDAWLEAKNTREKSFSLAAFVRPYVEFFPYALVHRHGQLIAFANVIATADRTELSIDLMRHLPDAPHGVMDFLFVKLMLWGQEHGYHWFHLGMAPLSGLEDHELAPLWNRLGNLVFRHGEHFYNFQGLRAYKEKFLPVWEPRYLVAPGKLALPQVLVDVASLISGGLRGLVSR